MHFSYRRENDISDVAECYDITIVVGNLLWHMFGISLAESIA